MTFCCLDVPYFFLTFLLQDRCKSLAAAVYRLEVEKRSRENVQPNATSLAEGGTYLREIEALRAKLSEHAALLAACQAKLRLANGKKSWRTKSDSTTIESRISLT